MEKLARAPTYLRRSTGDLTFAVSVKTGDDNFIFVQGSPASSVPDARTFSGFRVSFPNPDEVQLYALAPTHGFLSWIRGS